LVAAILFSPSFIYETKQEAQPMSVYIISQVTVHNREEYDTYSNQFMDIFQQLPGNC